MNPGIMNIPLLSAKDLLGKDERVEVTATSCPKGGKLSLKADEPQVGQQHEYVERKRENYYYLP